MRLTLRTLLAYMDDILDPSDQENLAQQVTESEKASELIHRTRDATRRLRLGAPPVLGEGMELDPNYAAEYLDSTLSGDEMGEYQQVCLDSDVHLAEVASCHHILTMVLGEPAEIDPEMRQRMYGVPGRVDEWHQSHVAAAAPAPAAAATAAAVPETQPAATGEDEPVSHVPDYLKEEESSNFGKLALAFAACLMLGVGAFVLFSEGGLLSGDQELAQNDPNATAGGPEGTANGGDVDVPPVPPLGPDDPVEPSTPGEPVEQPAEPEVEGGAAPEPPPTEPTTPPDTQAQDPEVDTPPMVTQDSPTEGATEPVVEPVVEPTDNATPPATPPTEDAQPTDPTTDEPPRVAMNTDVPTVPTTNVPTDNAAEAGDEAPLPPPEAAPMGTMIVTNQVLLRWDDETAEWYRMPPRASVKAGDQLLSLPTYRPSLSLAPVLRVEMCDGAMATVGYADDGKTIRLELAYGRFLLHNTGMETTEVELMVSGDTRTIELASTGVLGLDVDRPFVPGADVEASLGEFAATFYAPGGKVTWDTEGTPLLVDKPAQWSWKEPALVSITDNVEWLDGQSLDYLEQNVSSYFNKQLTGDQPARVQTLELYESSRRREDKALAAVCGTHVGQFVPFVQALADTQQQSSWDEHIAELRRAISRSTQAATLVHQTLTQQRGAALADDLFQMLRGYTPEQIGTTPEDVQSGVTRQLIDWLKHDRLEYRVLAIYNLKQIYGGKTLGYNPVITEPARQDRAVKQWRTRLADNELVPSHVGKDAPE
ncbi:hypothetical protein [Aeoliella sp.]|uniref:hypothetical protein n=1 Tax=Aeoliella sp. TaxID=2795800 RepID=UPI003CCBB7AA